MVPPDFFDNGAVVAVIGGRFLPVEELSIVKDVDVNHLSSSTSTKVQGVTKMEEYSVEFTTRRDPMLEPTIVTNGYIYNSTHRIVLDNVVGMSHGIVTEGWDNEYEVELILDGFTVMER